MRIAIIGGGWAGLAAAVRAVDQGHRVTLLEASAALGGRARSIEQHGQRFDNGQHILIGAYAQTLALMRQVGVDPEQALLRVPLSLTLPDGQGLALSSTSSVPAFVWAVLRHRQWPWTSRLALLLMSASWAAKGYDCAPEWTVERLTRRLPPDVRSELIDPLCVAALNTPASAASARVFLRVLNDALMRQRGGADLLLPRRPLSELLPEPALNWLRQQGAEVQLRQRAGAPERQGPQWLLNGEVFDQVVLACPAAEAARLTASLNPSWADQAQRLRQSAITTVYLACPGARLCAPMVFLAQGPAQFAFDHAAMGLAPDRFAFVISASDDGPGQSRAELAQAVLRQALMQFPAGTWPQAPQITGVFAERRATFECGPLVARPPASVAPGLWAAGDYIQGPYPSTLEGAVRSGQDVIEQLA